MYHGVYLKLTLFSLCQYFLMSLKVVTISLFKVFFEEKSKRIRSKMRRGSEVTIIDILFVCFQTCLPIILFLIEKSEEGLRTSHWSPIFVTIVTRVDIVTQCITQQHDSPLQVEKLDSDYTSRSFNVENLYYQ